MTASTPTDFFLREGDPPSKREILRSALHLFVRDGVCETSIRDIAEASGFTNPALYKFFESKEALALHLFERCYLELITTLRASMKRESFARDLDALVTAYAGLVDESLDAVLYVNDTLRTFWPRVSAAVRRHSLIGELRSLVRRGVESHVVPRAIDEDLAVAMVLGAMGQIARMAYFGEIRGPVSARVTAIRRLFGGALLERTS
jgi:AcrR family transcriptional regulator